MRKLIIIDIIIIDILSKNTKHGINATLVNFLKFAFNCNLFFAKFVPLHRKCFYRPFSTL